VTTVYDVTTWSVPGNPSASPYNDIGLVINSIIADIKSQQTSQASKPGGVIYIPPGEQMGPDAPPSPGVRQGC
jgi:inulin fructotransferase (DFA-I-forming)